MLLAVLSQDLKPENLMMFNGRLKLIDVDGCVPIDSEVGRVGELCQPRLNQALVSGVVVIIAIWAQLLSSADFAQEMGATKSSHPVSMLHVSIFKF